MSLPRLAKLQDSEDEASSESSSIGRPDDDSEDDDAQSSLSLGSLEDSLPIKKSSGLSNFYAGKSKSFGDMAEVSSLNDLAKSENPFNKRRRLKMKMAYSNSYSNLNNIKFHSNNNKTSSFYSHSNPISMPLLPLVEHDHDYDNDDDDDSSQDFTTRPPRPYQMGSCAPHGFRHHLSPRPQQNPNSLNKSTS